MEFGGYLSKLSGKPATKSRISSPTRRSWARTRLFGATFWLEKVVNDFGTNSNTAWNQHLTMVSWETLKYKT